MSKKNLVATLLLWITIADFSLLTPALETLSLSFPNTSFSTIMFSNTITGLIIVVVSIFAGIYAEKTGFRFMAIGGLAIATTTGIFPFFLSEISVYWPIIFSRVGVGIGVGMVAPVGGALISRFYAGKKRAQYFGVGNVFFVAGGVLYQLLGGWLASINWNYTFLGYLLALIPMIVAILFLPEPPEEQNNTENTTLTRNKSFKELFTGIPLVVFGYAAIEVCFATLDIPALFLTSTIVEETGMGTSTLAGILTSLYQISGVCIGAFFAIALKICKKRIFACAATTVALSYLIMLVAKSAFIYGIGMLLMGIGDIIFFTSAQYAANNATPDNKLAFTNGLMMAAMNLGAFFASYYLTMAQIIFPQWGTYSPFITSIVLLLIITIVMAILPHKNLLSSKQKET